MKQLIKEVSPHHTDAAEQSRQSIALLGGLLGNTVQQLTPAIGSQVAAALRTVAERLDNTASSDLK